MPREYCRICGAFRGKSCTCDKGHIASRPKNSGSVTENWERFAEETNRLWPIPRDENG